MNSCIFCGSTIQRPISLSFLFSFQVIKDTLACATCMAAFQRIDAKKACPGCSRNQEDGTLCRDCEKWRQYFPSLEPHHHALFTYNEAARTYMNQFKFQGDIELARLFSEALHRKLKPYTKTHLITTIPH